MQWRTLTRMLRWPTQRETIRTLAAGWSIAAICWYFGVDVWHAILLGCAITVAALAAAVGSSAPDARDLSWRPGKRASREGSRNDVASLSSSLHVGWGFVGLTAERHLNQIARRRLAVEGLDLRNPDDQPAIERLIGASAYRVLKRGQGRRLRLGRLLYVLNVLDAIDAIHYPAPEPRLRRRNPRPISSSLRRASDR